MAEYQWNASLLRHVFILPQDVADKHLRLAGAEQLKVLLWLARHDGVYDEEACSRAVGVAATECRDALRYWLDAGVLVGEETVAPPPTPTAPVAKPKVARPRPVKPQMPEVIEARESDPEFAYLEDEVAARLGRPLSPGDRETLLYLYRTAGLPAAVVLMVVGYAVETEHLTMRYIEKVALDWADKDILTMAAAEEYLCAMERRQTAVKHVQTVCGLDKPLTGTVAYAAAERWICDWSISDDVLRKAYEICREKTGKFQAGYMTRVLENWRDQGADTVEKIAELERGSSAESHDENNAYESMVEQYVPVYKKKKKG